MPQGAADYVALAVLASDPNFEEAAAQRRIATSSAFTSSRLVFWACICAFLSTALTFSLFLHDEFGIGSHWKYPSPTAGETIRHPNPYINLDKVLAAGTSNISVSIRNFPSVVLQMESLGPRRTVRHDDSRMRQTHLGTVYPDDRHIVVSAAMSTILHFRNLDYAMERCVLFAAVPVRTADWDPAVTLVDPSAIDIWKLKSHTELAPRVGGAWAGAPARAALLTTLMVSASGPSAVSQEFRCPSGEFTTLEIACSHETKSAKDCLIDFWQAQRADPVGGVFLTQFASMS